MDKAPAEPGLALFLRALLFPSLLPSQAALSVIECSEAHMIFTNCFMILSPKGKKKIKGKKWSQSCMLCGSIPAYYSLEFSEELLDLYGPQYTSRTEMFCGLVKSGVKNSVDLYVILPHWFQRDWKLIRNLIILKHTYLEISSVSLLRIEHWLNSLT